ncbi:MAG: hypothetical protein ACR2G6_09135 [Gemmatimonadaceae bacterium]
MNATLAQNLVIVRKLLAIIVVVAAGFWGMISLFSDYPPHWPFARWVLYALSGHVLAGFLIGMLLPLRWRLSIAAAWGAIRIGFMGLISMLGSSESDTGPQVPFVMRLASVLWFSPYQLRSHSGATPQQGCNKASAPGPHSCNQRRYEGLANPTI